MNLVRLTAIASVTAIVAACSSIPAPQYRVGAVMPLIVTDDPVAASSGPVKAGDTIARHKIRVQSGAVLSADAVGITRPIPAGTVLAEGLASEKGQIVKIFCDVRPVDAFSTTGATDCFQDADDDGKFETMWTGVPAISLFTLSLGSAGFHGAVQPVSYTITPPDQTPATEIGFQTFICWSGQPAFVLAFRRLDGRWNYGTGPCAPGEHPGETSKDGVFRGMGAGIKVTGTGDSATYELIERIPPGPITLGTRALRY